jgi:stress response protein YsnF
VVVRKDATERTETVRDTVRREDVEITKEPGVESSTGTAVGTATAHEPKI